MLLAPTGPCPTCQAPVVFTALRNIRNGRWTVLPVDPASVEHGIVRLAADPDTVHATVDLAGAPAGEWTVVEYAPGAPEPRWAPHPPSHWSLDEVAP